MDKENSKVSKIKDIEIKIIFHKNRILIKTTGNDLPIFKRNQNFLRENEVFVLN